MGLFIDSVAIKQAKLTNKIMFDILTELRQLNYNLSDVRFMISERNRNVKSN